MPQSLCPFLCVSKHRSVDDLEDIGDLEHYVEETAVMLLLLTKGCMLQKIQNLGCPIKGQLTPIEQCPNPCAAQTFCPEIVCVR